MNCCNHDCDEGRRCPQGCQQPRTLIGCALVAAVALACAAAIALGLSVSTPF